MPKRMPSQHPFTSQLPMPRDEFFHQTPAQIFAHLSEKRPDPASTCGMDGEQRNP